MGSREGLSLFWVTQDLADPEDSWVPGKAWEASAHTDLQSHSCYPAHVHPWGAGRISQNWPLVPEEGPELGAEDPDSLPRLN